MPTIVEHAREKDIGKEPEAKKTHAKPVMGVVKNDKNVRFETNHFSKNRI